MADKQIRVSEAVHAKVAKIAEENFRGLGDQVRYWAETTCSHPAKSRVQISVVVSPALESESEQAAEVGKGQPYRGFYCVRCQQYVLNTEPADEIKIALRGHAGMTA